MKFTPMFFVLVLFAGSIPSVASGQTKSDTPAPPPLKKSSTAVRKGRKAIPPPPPISSIKSPRKRRGLSAGTTGTVLGREETGRIDMSGKPVGFYPVTRGTDAVNPSRQAPATRSSRRG
jgi:hypothetical protein